MNYSSTPRVVLLIDSSHSFTRGLLRGICQYLKDHGPWKILREPVYTGQISTEARLRAMREFKPDGIIMREQNEANEAYLNFGVPTIYSPWSGPPAPGIPNLVEDPERVGRCAADYFRARGYHDFAYLGVPGMFWSMMRGKAFAARVQEHRGTCYVYEDEVSSYGKHDALANWLKSLPKPLALMTATDSNSLEAVEAARSVGLHVPEDIAVLGVNDDPLICDMSPVPLSSIQLNEESLGHQAAATLDTMIKGERSPSTKLEILPNRVVTRQSSDVLAVKDRKVAQAIGFINQNYRYSIGVDAIAEAAKLSRRVLEIRFRQHLDCTVYGLLQKTRMQKASMFLINTDHSIGEIASLCGFSELKQFSRSFQKYNSVSPRVYRERHRKIVNII